MDLSAVVHLVQNIFVCMGESFFKYALMQVYATLYLFYELLFTSKIIEGKKSSYLCCI